MNGNSSVRRAGHGTVRGSLGRLGLVLLLMGAAMMTDVPGVRAAGNTWTGASSMAAAREQHTATLLNNGTILVAGGQSAGTLLSSAELYTPSTNTWSAAASMNIARSGHTATLLSSGKVLVVGGPTADVYNPTTNTWTATSGAPAYAPGGRFTATLLGNGKVLVAGGGPSLSTTNMAQLYDPVTDAWAQTGSMNRLRMNHVAALLPNGKVLVAGGYSYNFLGRENTAELYDPSTGTWSLVPGVTYGPTYATLTVLGSGQALLAGGESCVPPASVTVEPNSVVPGGAGICPVSEPVPLTEIYDPTANTWTPTAPMGTARSRFGASLLGDGRVLVEGGQTLGSVTGPSVASSAEAYTPVAVAGTAGTWGVAASMANARRAHAATVENGKVLVTGGAGSSGSDQGSVESYTP